MNKYLLHITQSTLHFKKWSRKAYAEFMSIGRHVVIGQLKKGVADSSLSKQGIHSSETEDSNYFSAPISLDDGWRDNIFTPDCVLTYITTTIESKLDILAVQPTFLYTHTSRYIHSVIRI